MLDTQVYNAIKDITSQVENYYCALGSSMQYTVRCKNKNTITLENIFPEFYSLMSSRCHQIAAALKILHQCRECQLTLIGVDCFIVLSCLINPLEPGRTWINRSWILETWELVSVKSHLTLASLCFICDSGVTHA